MSATRRNRRLLGRNKKKLNVGMAIQAVKNIELMVEKGAMKFDTEQYHVHLLTEIFWDGKSEQHHANLAKNLLAYLDIQTNNADGTIDHILEIYSITTKTHLATYHNSELITNESRPPGFQ